MPEFFAAICGSQRCELSLTYAVATCAGANCFRRRSLLSTLKIRCRHFTAVDYRSADYDTCYEKSLLVAESHQTKCTQ